MKTKRVVTVGAYVGLAVILWRLSVADCVIVGATFLCAALADILEGN
jgi:hypothetical protein